MAQHTGGKCLIHVTNVAKTISCKAWNSHVEYPSRECNHDIKESEDYMFNPIFKENVQGRYIQGVAHLQNQNYLVTENLKCSSKVKNGHKHPIDSHNYHDENQDDIESYQGNSNRSS